MAKVYAIISGKGGVGKTTSVINLGTAINHLGEDAVIVDGNLTTPNIGIHLGAPIVPITLNHVLSENAKLEDSIYEHESGTKIIPSSLSLKEAEKINYKKIPEVTKKLKKITNHVLIDSSAGLGQETKAVISAADEIIIITNPEMAAVTDALKTIKISEEMKRPIKGIIITRYRNTKAEMSIQNIQDMLEKDIIGIVPEDEAIKESQALKNSVIHTHPKSKAAKSYLNIAKKILGEDFKEPPVKLGIWSRFLKSLGLR